MEGLISALEKRGVSMAELAVSIASAMADCDVPGVRYRYFEILWADDVTTEELIMVVGEVAVRIQKERHYELMRELSIRELFSENSDVKLKLFA